MKHNYPFDRTEPTTADRIRHAWHKIKPVRPVRIDNTREINRKITRELIQLTIILCAVVVIGMVMIQAVKEFAIQANEVRQFQSDMNGRADTMQSELTELAEKVEKWEGIR